MVTFWYPYYSIGELEEPTGTLLIVMVSLMIPY